MEYEGSGPWALRPRAHYMEVLSCYPFVWPRAQMGWARRAATSAQSSQATASAARAWPKGQAPGPWPQPLAPRPPGLRMAGTAAGEPWTHGPYPMGPWCRSILSLG